MSNTATIDAPDASAVNAANDTFKSVSSFEFEPAEQEFKEAPKPEPAKEEIVVEKPKETPDPKKGKLDKVGGIKKPEADKPETGAIVDPTKPKGDKEENMAVLRKTKEEYERLKPEYEKLKPEYETTKAELAKLKAMGLNDEERKEFQRMREVGAVEAVRNSKEFQEKIMAPIQKKIAGIKSVAANAKLNPQQTSALLDACDIEDEFQRNKAIRGIVKGAGEEDDLDLDDYQALADSAIASARDLQENLYPKHDEALSKAQEVQMAARSRQQQESQQMTQKQQQELAAAHKEVWNILSSDKLKPILDEKDFSIEGITMSDAMQNATPADNPTDRAFEVQAAAAMPFLIEYANRALAKAAKLEFATQKRSGSSPDRHDGATKPQDLGKEKPVSADEVFKAKNLNFMAG